VTVGTRTKGVSSIRTLASIRGSGAHSGERHVHQFQIASLELERTRRTQERQSTLNRLKNLEERLAGIEALIRQHQEALGTSGPRPERVKTEAKIEENGKRNKLRY
jgi:septal ring factor EnvC (AmiA/AmiB activator)